jgi:hypothetical protein
MDCPTCFQKITVPQAPANADQKFILTGSKVVEKAVATPAEVPAASPVKKFPGILIVVLILAFMGVAAGAIYWTTLRHRPAPVNSTNPLSPATNPAVSSSSEAKTRPEPVAPVAPSANDTNWMLVLETNSIPDSPVAGRIHGLNFLMERTTLQNGALMLRSGTHGSVEFGAAINFNNLQPETLSGKSLSVTTNVQKAVRITLRWKDEAGTVQKASYDYGYAMRLEFGALANNRLPGKIYLCLPDEEKSYLVGSFTADARKPKAKAPKK